MTWQLAVKKEINDNLTLRATGGTYYRLLNLYEIVGDGAQERHSQSPKTEPRQTSAFYTTGTYREDAWTQS